MAGLLWLYPIYVSGQSSSSLNESLFWLKYQNRLKFSDHWHLDTEIESRRWLNTGRSDQWLPGRITLAYRQKRWGLGAGGVYFLQFAYRPSQKSPAEIIPELRPHQDVYWRSTPGRFKWDLRVRLEERLFKQRMADNRLENGFSDMQWRLRTRVNVHYRLLEKQYSSLWYHLGSEIMLHAGDRINGSFFDQNRLFTGIKWTFNSNIALDLSYIYWYQYLEPNTNPLHLHRHVAHLTLLHTISL